MSAPRGATVRIATGFTGALFVLVVIYALDSIDRYRIAPSWLPDTVVAIVALSICISMITRSPFWRRVELIVLWGAVVVSLFYNALNLYSVSDKMIFHSVQASTLFYTALGIWINNVLNFTVLYWLFDGGGPDARRAGAGYPDFDFPASDLPEKVPPGWQPGLVDYFFLGFTTATAFSPTEAQPLTARAKLCMVAEGILSLTTVTIVGARAINIIQ
jgi:hypothetical protein